MKGNRTNHPKNGEVRKCIVCQKEFYILPHTKLISSQGLYCSQKCYGNSRIVWSHKNCIVCNKEFDFKPYSKQANIYCSRECHGKDNHGYKNPAWKGGVVPEHKKLRGSKEYAEWRMSVFIRDDFTCQICGRHGGDGKRIILNADHILPFSQYPELRLDIDNGRTLCKKCHSGITKEQMKHIWINQFIINKEEKL